MIELRSQNGQSETLFSVSAISRHESLRGLNIMQICRQYHGVAVEIAGNLYCRADKLAAVLGKDSDALAALCMLVDRGTSETADGPIIPASPGERQAIVNERRKRADADYSASLSR